LCIVINLSYLLGLVLCVVIGLLTKMRLYIFRNITRRYRLAAKLRWQNWWCSNSCHCICSLRSRTRVFKGTSYNQLDYCLSRLAWYLATVESEVKCSLVLKCHCHRVNRNTILNMQCVHLPAHLFNSLAFIVAPKHVWIITMMITSQLNDWIGHRTFYTLVKQLWLLLWNRLITRPRLRII